MFKKFAHFVVRHNISIIIIAVLITGVFAYFTRNVEISSNLMDLVPEDNRELKQLNETLQKFGSSTFVMISVKAEDPFSLSTLTKIKEISNKIKKLPQVEEVIDPLNAKVFEYLFGMVVVKQSFPEKKIPESQQKIERLKNELLSEPTLKNVVVSENGEALAIYIKLKDDCNSQQIRQSLLNIIS
ncbi:MAG: hypothetical protein ACOC7U_10745, partial [Spirochaetota bacterium]